MYIIYVNWEETAIEETWLAIILSTEELYLSINLFLDRTSCPNFLYLQTVANGVLS